MFTRRQFVGAFGLIITRSHVALAQEAKRDVELATVTLIIDGMT
jgi:hypothetical protein